MPDVEFLDLDLDLERFVAAKINIPRCRTTDKGKEIYQSTAGVVEGRKERIRSAIL
jgi:hypothetical protein